MGKIGCCEVFIYLLLPPLGLYLRRNKCDADVCINLLLTFFVGFGVVHAFWLEGLTCCVAFWIAVLAPIGMCCAGRPGKEVCISILLTLLFVIPGVMYSYHICVNQPEIQMRNMDKE